MHGFFVTGTDTGVGKTLVTGALAAALRRRGFDVGVAKPVQSGSGLHEQGGDTERLRALAGVLDDPAELCVYAFEAPLAPLVAAELAGERVELDRIESRLAVLAARHEALLVEGAGGLLTPLAPGTTMLDLAERLALPLLVVARDGLGTVNHTLLTVEAARRRGVEVVGVIMSAAQPVPDGSEQRNAELVEAFAAVPVIGRLPWLDGDRAPARLAELARAHIDLARLEAAL